MELYRICPEHYLENFSGMGASFTHGARWNLKAYPVLYFALSPSVAMLEMANYLPSPRLVPKNYRLGVYHLPEQYIEHFSAPLTEEWAEYPYPLSTQILGSQWLSKSSNTALVLPSAATPNGLESIAMLNPLHGGIKQLALVKSYQDIFNKRAFTGLR
jgi:RES domain-containing protein